MNGFDPVGLETVEAEAIADAFGSDAVRVAGAVCAVRPDLEEAAINRVIGLGMSEPASERALDRIADIYGDVRHTIAVAPAARPPTLADMLRARGYAPGYAWVKFHRPTSTPLQAATDLRVERIGAESAERYIAVVAAGFGLAPSVTAMLEHLPGRRGWGSYLAYDGAIAVACGAVFVHGDHAWLGQAATLPEHRRRGGQSALLAARIAEARERGAAVVVTEIGKATPGRPGASYRNVVRAGFQPAYVRANYVSPPADVVA